MLEPDQDDAASRRRAEIGGDGLRGRVAGGTMANTLFMLGMNGLSIVQGLLLAGLLGAKQYGLWGLLTMTFGTLFALTAVGVDDKYIQQDHEDQESAFQIAFTMQVAMCALFTVLAMIAVPLFSALYDQPKILLPGMLLALVVPLLALQTPMWVFYRRMDFRRLRLLESIDPVAAFVVTVTLGFMGAGFWSFVWGAIAGGIVAAVVAIRNSPYPLRLRYERGVLRDYASFSWPLFVGSITGILMFQIPITIASRHIGPAAVGAIALSAQITQYTRRVDDVVSHAMYPAICAVKDRVDLMLEAFTKSNRLALLWGFPVGIGTALFAAAAVPLVFGHRWELAVPLIQVLGLAAAVQQIAFNWDSYARARAETRILAVGAVVSMVAVLAVGVPLLYSNGLRGFAYGLAAGTLANIVVRLWYLARLFPALRIARHVAPAIVPGALGAVAILAGRAALGSDNSAGRLAAEAAVYASVVAAVSWITARPLLVEAFGYVRRVARRAAVPAT